MAEATRPEVYVDDLADAVHTKIPVNMASEVGGKLQRHAELMRHLG